VCASPRPPAGSLMAGQLIRIDGGSHTGPGLHMVEPDPVAAGSAEPGPRATGPAEPGAGQPEAARSDLAADGLAEPDPARPGPPDSGSVGPNPVVE